MSPPTASLRDKIHFMRSGLNVRRYHQHTTLEVDTVGKHSAGVALFVLLIYPDASRTILAAAVSHDLGEWALGDIPAPTKRAMSPMARREIDSIESYTLNYHGYDPDDLTDSEHTLLKLADYCDGLSFAIEERRRGNTTLTTVAVTYVQYLNQLLAKAEGPWVGQAHDVVMALEAMYRETYK